MVKIYCDYCGKEIKGITHTVRVSTDQGRLEYDTPNKRWNQCETLYSASMCESCFNELFPKKLERLKALDAASRLYKKLKGMIE